jgi:hypothetical protein
VIASPRFWQIGLTSGGGRGCPAASTRTGDIDVNPTRFTLPGIPAILPDLVAFTAGIACARLLGWNTTDLVWSLWLSSLVLGYLTIVAMIGEGVYIGSAAVLSDLCPPQFRLKAILAGMALALFLLGFFSIHFCGFHAVHASFLSSFFPLDGVPKRAFAAASFNPISLWTSAFHYLMPRYGAFLIPVVIAERHNLFRSIGNLVHARHELASGQVDAPLLAGLFGATGAARKNFFGRPYINVLRMHLLIFVFAICQALKVDAFAVYVVVSAVYFFPWSAFKPDAGGTPGDAAAGGAAPSA